MAIMQSYFSRISGTNNVSAGNGPDTSMPTSLAPRLRRVASLYLLLGRSGHPVQVFGFSVSAGRRSSCHLNNSSTQILLGLRARDIMIAHCDKQIALDLSSNGFAAGFSTCCGGMCCTECDMWIPTLQVPVPPHC